MGLHTTFLMRLLWITYPGLTKSGRVGRSRAMRASARFRSGGRLLVRSFRGCSPEQLRHLRVAVPDQVVTALAAPDIHQRSRISAIPPREEREIPVTAREHGLEHELAGPEGVDEIDTDPPELGLDEFEGALPQRAPCGRNEAEGEPLSLAAEDPVIAASAAMRSQQAHRLRWAEAPSLPVRPVGALEREIDRALICLQARGDRFVEDRG